MPRTADAKLWKPDAFGREAIERITKLVVVAEECGAHLRSLGIPSNTFKLLWATAEAEFRPERYPVVLADDNNIDGRIQFRRKYEAICFPSTPPDNLLDYIKMIFAAHAGLQSISTQDIYEHPYEGEIHYRSNLEALKIIGGPAYEAAIAEDAKNTCDHPLDRLYEIFSCREEGSDKIVKYTVVDYIVSAVTGEGSFVLRDGDGTKKQVTVLQFQEMCIPED